MCNMMGLVNDEGLMDDELQGSTSMIDTSLIEQQPVFLDSHSAHISAILENNHEDTKLDERNGLNESLG